MRESGEIGLESTGSEYVFLESRVSALLTENYGSELFAVALLPALRVKTPENGVIFWESPGVNWGIFLPKGTARIQYFSELLNLLAQKAQRKDSTSSNWQIVDPTSIEEMSVYTFRIFMLASGRSLPKYLGELTAGVANFAHGKISNMGSLESIFNDGAYGYER